MDPNFGIISLYTKSSIDFSVLKLAFTYFSVTNKLEPANSVVTAFAVVIRALVRRDNDV